MVDRKLSCQFLGQVGQGEVCATCGRLRLASHRPYYGRGVGSVHCHGGRKTFGSPFEKPKLPVVRGEGFRKARTGWQLGYGMVCVLVWPQVLVILPF